MWRGERSCRLEIVPLKGLQEVFTRKYLIDHKYIPLIRIFMYYVCYWMCRSFLLWQNLCRILSLFLFFMYCIPVTFFFPLKDNLQRFYWFNIWYSLSASFLYESFPLCFILSTVLAWYLFPFPFTHWWQ